MAKSMAHLVVVPRFQVQGRATQIFLANTKYFSYCGAPHINSYIMLLCTTILRKMECLNCTLIFVILKRWLIIAYLVVPCILWPTSVGCGFNCTPRLAHNVFCKAHDCLHLRTPPPFQTCQGWKAEMLVTWMWFSNREVAGGGGREETVLHMNQ